jgi:hypothetical protein
LPAFVWMIAWRDAAEREDVWGSFYADDEWWRIRAATNDGTELVDDYGLWFMRPHRRSPALFAGPPSGPLHEMIVLETGIGRAPAVDDLLAETVVPLIDAAGGSVSGMFDMIAGPRVPTTVLLLSWPDFSTRHAWHDGITRHPAMRAAGRAGLIGRCDIYLLRPESPAASSSDSTAERPAS